jgi:hypothetical protein
LGDNGFFDDCATDNGVSGVIQERMKRRDRDDAEGILAEAGGRGKVN